YISFISQHRLIPFCTTKGNNRTTVKRIGMKLSNKIPELAKGTSNLLRLLDSYLAGFFLTVTNSQEINFLAKNSSHLKMTNKLTKAIIIV
ncbi:MAG: hypothetical protein ACOC0N_04085, partial [Chroococcales cyanobacterium]